MGHGAIMTRVVTNSCTTGTAKSELKKNLQEGSFQHVTKLNLQESVMDTMNTKQKHRHN